MTSQRPKRKRLTVRLEADEHEKVSEAAVRCGVSENQAFRKLTALAPLLCSQGDMTEDAD